MGRSMMLGKDKPREERKRARWLKLRAKAFRKVERRRT